MTPALDIRFRLAQMAIAMVAVMLGIVAGLNPLYAILAIVGAAFVALVLSDMTLGLCLFVVVSFIDTVPNPLGTLSVVKLIGLLIALTWLANIAIGEQGRGFAATYPVATAICLAIVVWVGMSALWAESLSAFQNTAQTWVLDLALFPILFAGLREPRHVAWLFAAFVIGTILSAGYGVASGSAAEVAGRIGGAGLGANILGSLAAAGAVLAATLGVYGEWPRPARGLAFLGAAFCVLTIFLTGSREAILGLALALVASPFIAGRGRRAAMISGSVVAALAAVVLFIAFTPPTVRSHLFASDPTGSGRTDIWQVGLRMVKANPVLGVGAGNFPVASIHYLSQPGVLQFSQFIVDQPKVAHNIYLEVLAELGVVGFLLFAALMAFCLTCGVRAARQFAEQKDRAAELLARGLVLALIGLLASDFFGSELLSKQLWLLLATTPALLSIAQSRSGGRQLPGTH